MTANISSCITLAELHTGEQATVIEMKGGKCMTSRLASLGLTPGAKVNMTQNFMHGPLMVTVRGTRVALGRGEAMHILIQTGEK